MASAGAEQVPKLAGNETGEQVRGERGAGVGELDRSFRRCGEGQKDHVSWSRGVSEAGQGRAEGKRTGMVRGVSVEGGVRPGVQQA